MASTQEHTTITLQCHCKAVTVSIDLPTSKLPLSLRTCSCTTCRLVSGQLCVTVSTIPVETPPFRIEGHPKSYRTWAIDRYFCGTCGTSLIEQKEDGKRCINTGSMKKVSDETSGKLIVKFDQHIWVGDTNDGGIRDIVAELDAFHEGANENQEGFIAPGPLYGPAHPPPSMDDESEELQCGCHCGGVSFSITRPNAASRAAIVKEKLDLNVAWYEPEEKRENKGNEPFWIRGEDGQKYLAGLCVCDDCRTASGCEVQAWTWIPIVNLHVKNRESSTLKRYKGSERAWREFCGRCGATAFFGMEETEGKREVIDVSVGLMSKSSKGARVEEWLDWWTDRVSYEDLADNKPFAEILGIGVRNWASKRKQAQSS